MVVYSEGVEFGLGQLSIGATLPLMLADEGGCSRWVYMVCLDFGTLVTIFGETQGSTRKRTSNLDSR